MCLTLEINWIAYIYEAKCIGRFHRIIEWFGLKWTLKII